MIKMNNYIIYNVAYNETKYYGYYNAVKKMSEKENSSNRPKSYVNDNSKINYDKNNILILEKS